MTHSNNSANTATNIKFATHFQEHWVNSGNNFVENTVGDIFVKVPFIAE